MNDVDMLFELWKKSGTLTDSQIKELYFLSPKVYDYDNHNYNSKIATILSTRNVKADLANILECMESEIATPDDKLSMDHLYLYDGLHIVNLYTHEVVNGNRANISRYKNYKEKPLSNEQKANILIKKSVIPEYAKRPYRYVKKEMPQVEIKKRIIKAVIGFTATAALIGVIVYGYKLDEDNKYINMFIDNNRHIISDEVVMVDNDNHYYLHDAIAKNILNSSEDTEALIYVAYDYTKKDAATISGHNDAQIKNNMDELMKDLSSYSERFNYSTFDEYLVAKGFVKNDGTTDINKYNSAMRSYIDDMIKNNEVDMTGGKAY